MEKIGFITTIPVEVIFAAGKIPVDLNNVFVTSANAAAFVAEAEDHGFPRNFCTWIKGAFSVAQNMGIKKIVMVSEGECTNSEKLAEVLARFDMEMIPFSYPQNRNYGELKKNIEQLMRACNVSWDTVAVAKMRIDGIRKKLQLLDQYTVTEGTVSGGENFSFLISSTDFGGDLVSFEQRLDTLLADIEKRQMPQRSSMKRIGVVGIPPIISDLFDSIEQLGGAVVFNEMPRQFAMTHYTEDIVEQYRHFTYPYNVRYRIEDIKKEIAQREIDGIIHYIQSFCPKQVDDIAFRQELKIPYLTIESDRPGKLDERNVTRLEAFFERLQET